MMNGMTALEFIDLVCPEHTRTSCSDDHRGNGFFTRGGDSWHGRCTRCMYLEAMEDNYVPQGFRVSEAVG